MARVILSEADFVGGGVPTVCAKSGKPAHRTVRVIFSDRPGLGLVPLLIIFGPISYLLFRRALAKRIVAVLPLADGPRLRFLVTRWTSIGLFSFAISQWLIVLLLPKADPGFLGVLAVSGLLCLLLLIAIAQFAGRAFGFRGRLQASSPHGKRFVELSNVHPDFAEAVRRNNRPHERSLGY